MKISLILMAVLLAVVPVLGLSAPSASAEEVVSYPDVINQGDILYINPNLFVTVPLDGSIVYGATGTFPQLNVRFFDYTIGPPVSYSFVSGYFHLVSEGSGGSYFPFYFYSSDSSLVGVNLNSLGSSSIYPDYVFQESDLNKPIYFFDSFTYNLSSVSFFSDSLSLDTTIFSLDPNAFLPTTEDTFVGVWGETAEFVGDIFIQVGDLFYDDTAEDLTPIGTLAVILAGIAVVLLVWNLIRSFLPMRG